MKLHWVAFVQTFLLPAAALWQVAAAAERGSDYRRSMGNLRPSHRTAGPAIQGSPPPRAYPSRGRGPSHGHRFSRYPRYDYSFYSYYPYPYTYPVYNYLVYPYFQPYVPAGVLIDRLGLPPIVPQVIARRQPEDDQPAEEKVPRGSNPRAINLGWRFIGFGDARFSEQEYAEAYVRYKKAAQAAPVLADAYFRQGYALIALGRYELAATALKRGLEIDPGWAGSDFRNDDLYADHPQAKMAHLDALAQAAVEQPNDADLLFLVGVFLHFDGQTDRAKPFFRRAARIAGVGGDIHLRGFLEGGQ